ncbi:hypothetical protein INR49_026354 [Caranx melampygus]|nr:hypothetical protein INR49_026354 [Caranx melampygus]
MDFKHFKSTFWRGGYSRRSQGSIAEEEVRPRGFGDRSVVIQVICCPEAHTDRPVTPRPSPFCLLTLISHPQEKGSPAWSSGVRAIWDAGSPDPPSNRMSGEWKRMK